MVLRRNDLASALKLSTLQQIFAVNLAKLIIYINEQGYGCTGSEWFRTTEQAEWNAARGIGIRDSQHCIRLACDLNLFKHGVYLSTTDAHKQFGEYWESLNSLNRWGGRFKDGNHYEMKEEA